MNILITGASSGIGAALAFLLATPNNTLMLIARRADRLATVTADATAKGAVVHQVLADLEHESECLRVAEIAQGSMSHVDWVIHNAGRGHYSAVQHTTTQTWRTMFALNVDAPFFLTRALLPGMLDRNSGHHVYVSSMAGKIGYPYNAAYVAAKHALVGFVAGLRAELLHTNVLATVVCPSGVASEWGGVTDGGSINDLYAAAIPKSRAIAKEQGLRLAPLKKLISSESAALIIADVLHHGRSNDVYTHEGTMELAVQANTARTDQEEHHRALWLAMAEVYNERK